MTNEKDNLVKQIKKYFEEEALNKQNITKQFSNDVIDLAYQKLSESMRDLLDNEEDPAVLLELLRSYVDVTSLVENKDLQRQQMLLKLFEQLNKYEQSRYY